MRCDLCRYSCKESESKCEIFHPKDEFLGKSIHFKEDPTRHYSKHESTSVMCVVCKDYHNRTKIKWIKLEKGFYPFCVECAHRHAYIAKNAPVG